MSRQLDILAFDIGGTKIGSALVSFNLDNPNQAPEVINEQAIPTNAQDGGAVLLQRIVHWCSELLQAYATKGHLVKAIGIATAGVPDSIHGKILAATNLLPGWAGQDIYKAFNEISNLPVYMVGDVGAHGLGEAVYGAGAQYETVLSIGVGTGIGGAFINQGKIIAGAHGVAGHAGHIESALGKGFLCSCGTRSGHIEPVASGTGLATLYNARLEEMQDNTLQPVESGARVCQRAANGEIFAQDILTESGFALGTCIAGMCNLLDPHVIILSGSVVKAGELWWEAVRKGFADASLTLVKSTPLVEGNLGGCAPLIGAAIAVKKQYQL
ncbi:MAG: ROK family protein [Bifidobacteriaceae bacterium]|nr:ROK family protein [Bifidobacteriaceae bacterium]